MVYNFYSSTRSKKYFVLKFDFLEPTDRRKFEAFSGERLAGPGAAPGPGADLRKSYKETRHDDDGSRSGETKESQHS